jgi:membrane protein DedA with SNARE-associated domain
LQTTRRVTDLVQAMSPWLAANAYAFVFVVALIDSLGVPFPGRLLLVASGAFAAAAGDVNVALLIALGAAGVLAADHLWYFAGALGSRRLLGVYCRLAPRGADCERRAADWLTRLGALVVPAGRAVAAIRMLAWPLARGHGVSYPVFLLLDVPAATAWTAIWVGGGWLVGERWAAASDELRWAGAGVAAVLTVGGVLVVLWRRRRHAPAVS